MKKTMILILCLMLCVIFLAGCSAADSVADELAKQKAYSEAMRLLDAGDAQQAYDLLRSISDYRDVSEYLDRFVFRYDHVTIKESGDTIEILYEYDSYGRLVRSEYSKESEYFPLYTEMTEYEYSDGNEIVKCTQKRSNEETERVTLYDYDEQGNLIKLTNPVGSSTEFSYDAQGNVIEEKQFSVSGEIIMRFEYAYNEHGDVVSCTQTDHMYGDSAKTFTYAYEYDSNGNKIKMQADGVLDEWEYDELGREIMYARHAQSGMNGVNDFFIRTTKYDRYGNYAERTVQKPSGTSTTVYERGYDHYGVALWEKISADGEVRKQSTYHHYQVYYNPYGEPAFPDEYLGIEG